MPRLYEFHGGVWQAVANRQNAICAACGKGLLAFNDEGDRDVFGHHVIPDQCGKHRPRYADFLRTAPNCVLVCKECHWAAHEYGKYEYGIVANPDFFPFSHGKDMIAHRAWCKSINDRWDLLFPAARKRTP
jgi:hypothetical protein